MNGRSAPDTDGGWDRRDETPPLGSPSLAAITLVVCGAPGRELQAVASALAGAGRFVVRAIDDDARAAADAFASPAPVACVLIDDDRAPAPLISALASRPPNVPLVAIGGQPDGRVRPSCWLPARPAPGLLFSVLARVLGATTDGAPRAGRRKSDLIVGNSAGTRELMRALDRIAGSSAPVLITGESGTGKDLVARALHACGPRASRPFTAVNCGAIPETLFEAELFGYNRGAFTGAVAARPGVFEAAEDGTLFLDEIGEIPPAMQVKLLRVLETGEITRLGSNQPRRSTARIVAATNRDLDEEMRQGRFRQDLYYRLHVCPIHIPPLRERAEDIPPLAVHYLAELAARERRPPPRLAPRALEAMLGYDWPGNVRQLVSVLQRALLVATGGVIEPEHLDLPTPAQPSIPSYRDAKHEFELRYYGQLMRSAGGSVSVAARLADKTRKEIYDALARLKLDRSGTPLA